MAVEILADREALHARAAALIAQEAAAAIGARGRFTLALSGGSTPQPVYERLAAAPLRDQIDWERVYVVFGDERCVPPDDTQSNYRLAREALFARVPLPEANIYRMRGEDEPAAAAEAYAEALAGLLGGDAALGGAPLDGLDLALQGMGDDGHTASLFPGHAAVQEKVRWAVAEYIDTLGMWRLTLTPVLLNASRHVVFLVAGADKASRLAEVLEGPFEPERLPAQAIRPTTGALTWLVDAEAGARLASDTEGVA